MVVLPWVGLHFALDVMPIKKTQTNIRTGIHPIFTHLFIVNLIVRRPLRKPPSYLILLIQQTVNDTHIYSIELIK